ncbi:sarcosine oxidase subunit gamma [Mesorhizobium sp. Root157]|uniref:sarcosine oxidase subunit gamma n=1 Tax=Mesorhizobium sp. Root157 TaxID=1736477 RepID=UPI0006F553EF|nr:sarcosine oxidase subunit gamma family protein [Mesorhizobium sp. Root157]KRA00092.1 sarcosine oxidase subunit gamma [Mesorhizobium sp. Root157]
MPDFLWNSQSPLEKAVIAGRHGAGKGTPGVSLSHVGDIALVQVMARRGRNADVAKAAKKLFGTETPAMLKVANGKSATLIWSGPDQFLAFSQQPRSAPSLEQMEEAFAGTASLSNQSDGRCLIRISGPSANDALAKLTSLDLHDSVFPVGAAATTSIDHTAVNFWREADDAGANPAYAMLVFTSFADTLWHLIVDSSLEYGVEVAAIGAGH